MFVGDRGHGFGSRIKGHRQFDGFWKQQRHGRYTPTLITSEPNKSQTCAFCFHKLFHPVAALNGKIQQTAGSFLCLNPECPNAFKTMCRDQVSALAIGLAGLGCLLFGRCIFDFDLLILLVIIPAKKLTPPNYHPKLMFMDTDLP
ncbi:hypothetical protein BD408DRAFT_483137 [Parasitella parasitica]|nr:hypothetical protein BD408DRAFT_483137 [Parasitella parasitica]